MTVPVSEPTARQCVIPQALRQLASVCQQRNDGIQFAEIQPAPICQLGILQESPRWDDDQQS